MKRFFILSFMISHAGASHLFQEYTAKFTNARTCPARIAFLEENDPHTQELTQIYGTSTFSDFDALITNSPYARFSLISLDTIRQSLIKTADKLFITQWAQSGNINYPPDRAITTLLSIKSNLLHIERQFPRFTLPPLPPIVEHTVLKRRAPLAQKYAYIYELQNGAQDILFRVLYKFKLIQKIVLRFSGDLPATPKGSPVKRKAKDQGPAQTSHHKKRSNMIPSEQLPQVSTALLLRQN